MRYKEWRLKYGNDSESVKEAQEVERPKIVDTWLVQLLRNHSPQVIQDKKEGKLGALTSAAWRILVFTAHRTKGSMEAGG